jgi:hypothetical protein
VSVNKRPEETASLASTEVETLSIPSGLK